MPVQMLCKLPSASATHRGITGNTYGTGRQETPRADTTCPPALNLGCGHSSRRGPCWGWMVPPGPKVQAECRQWLLQLLASVLASTERCGHPTQQIAHSRCRQLVDVRVFPAPNPQTTCFCTKDRCRCPQITVRKRWPP